MSSAAPGRLGCLQSRVRSEGGPADADSASVLGSPDPAPSPRPLHFYVKLQHLLVKGDIHTPWTLMLLGIA